MRKPDNRRLVRILITAIVLCSGVVIWLVQSSRIPVASAQVGFNTSFRSFEAPQVHPLALTPDGKHLLAVNSPNATISVFELNGGTPFLSAEIAVGLEPVSIAARTDREIWVVNWLSDSISIVDLTTGNVVRTIDVGDEPTDILFAGTNNEKAFVCLGGGGHQTIDGITITGASGAVKVLDPANLNSSPQTIEIFAKQPRALARNADGSRVFVSVFESGNQTTLIPERAVQQNGGLPAPNPAMDAALPPFPNTALIVKWNGNAWADETGDTKWNPFVSYTLADIDLVTIDAAAANPSITSQLRGLATHLGNMAFDSRTNRLFIANRDSGNVQRFEPNLRGRFQANRISIFNTGGGAPAVSVVRDLNQHIDFSNPAGNDAERADSLALPADLVRADDGKLYLAATSSAKVGVLDSSGNVVSRIVVGQGPTGLALDNNNHKLYVLNRFDESISIVDTVGNTQLTTVPLGFNPEPSVVRAGRRFLYDARSFSAHGTVSCASCHPGGHRDGLAWDLGDPTGTMVTVNGHTHHPMKGPMMTQSLRGLLNATPLHWRADRRDVSEFNIAFTGLLGSERLLTSTELNDFISFVNTLSYPPNPNENLDRTFPNPTFGPNAKLGSQRFTAFRGLPFLFLGNANNCGACHQFSSGLPNSFIMGSIRAIFPGSILSEPQTFKVPQLRGIYQKAGLQKPVFGQPRAEQLTGFGFMHDGQMDTLLNFLRQPDFVGFNNDDERRDIEAFLLSFDSVMAPSVGLQVTVNSQNKNSAEVLARINLLIQQAQVVPIPNSNSTMAPSCDLVVRGVDNGSPRSYLQLANGIFQPDSSSEATVTVPQLLALVTDGNELTFTGVPQGEGRRFSIDRNGDGILNADEARSSVQIAGRVVDLAGNGIGGVTVNLSGKQAATATTDSHGNYVFNFVSTFGTHVVTPSRVGFSFSPQSREFVNPVWNQTGTFITAAAGNASDASSFLVEQHYTDFLNRAPDAPGLQFWVDQIESCGSDAACREVRRINVSGAFFQAIEFQETGYLAYRTYKSSFGDLPGKPVPITFSQLMAESQHLGRNVIVNVGQWQQQLETNKQAFFNGWVQRAEFLARYPASMSPSAFVDALNANTAGALNTATRDALVAQLTSNNTVGGRALIVRQVAENSQFSKQEFNKAFVLMQYFGYLRRNPDDAPEVNRNFDGYNFWLGKLNQFNGNFVEAEMVKAFITSGEYRSRFGF